MRFRALEVAAAVGGELVGDDVTLATGPNVMANAATSAAFYKGVISYLQNPGSLDSVLQTIQKAADGS